VQCGYLIAIFAGSRSLDHGSAAGEVSLHDKVVEVCGCRLPSQLLGPSLQRHAVLVLAPCVMGSQHGVLVLVDVSE
jgi:hypothetical protein